jgi:hypothetical protein
MGIIDRTGLEPWPKVFQNLCSTRETELAEEFPMDVVCAWIGNSKAVAAKHYLQVTESHFDQTQRAKTGATTCQNVSKPAPQKSAVIRTF